MAEKPSSQEIKLWLRLPQGEWFLEQLKTESRNVETELRSLEGNQLYRAQGRAELLDRLDKWLSCSTRPTS